MDDDHAEPMNVIATCGSVVVLGPARMEGSFSPEAAETSAIRLLMAAADARQARDSARLVARPPDVRH